ncbi:HAD hydrolase-like protein [Agromyces humi]|uniref:HAD hydrolase-like protein n=1 Tax=Agromyces humi TaxID=1766800 RepID=UPI001359559C|nr:HAD hydrolase-like protein [Agromyces humi]
MHTRTTWPTSSERERTILHARDAVIVWDFDGTIVDTEHLHQQTILELLTRRGYTPEAGWFDLVMGTPEEVTWERLASQGAPVDTPAEMIAERRGLYIDRAIAEVSASWIAGDLVPAFDRVGATQLVLSNGDFESNKAILDHIDLPHLTMIERGHGSKAGKIKDIVPDMLLDDRASYITLGTQLGAWTVGVHTKATLGLLPADVPVSIA